MYNYSLSSKFLMQQRRVLKSRYKIIKCLILFIYTHLGCSIQMRAQFQQQLKNLLNEYKNTVSRKINLLN